jgi:hypothetical protein
MKFSNIALCNKKQYLLLHDLTSCGVFLIKNLNNMFNFSIKFLLLALLVVSLVANKKYENPSNATLIIENFLKLSGGSEKWSELNSFYSKIEEVKCIKSVSEKKTNNSIEIWYKNNKQGGCFVKQDDENRQYGNSSGYWLRRNKSFDWISLNLTSSYTGITIKIDYTAVCYALEFSKRKDNLKELYILSEAMSDDRFYVVEKLDENKKEALYNSEFKNYLFFSKKNGLLTHDILFVDNKLLKHEEFLDYTSFNGYLFPVTKKVSLTLPKELLAIVNRENLRNGETNTDNTKIITYQKVIFNQPIDESVFDMN